MRACVCACADAILPYDSITFNRMNANAVRWPLRVKTPVVSSVVHIYIYINVAYDICISTYI